MANLSSLKKEIENTKSISKITSAMQLVASTKLRKIGKKITEQQEYIKEIYDVFNLIIQNVEDSIFLKKNNIEAKKTLWIAINSNLGLCGAYNANVNRLIMSKIKSNDEIFAIGNKAISFYNIKKIKIKSQMSKMSMDFKHEDATIISQDILKWFNEGIFDEVKLVYTKLVNNITFEPTELLLFPIEKNTDENNILKNVYFEPNATEVLEASINLYLNNIIYGTIIESQIAEEASRRMAMENATNNSNEFIDKLNIEYNRKRQSSITQEITEIISGSNASNNKERQ